MLGRNLELHDLKPTTLEIEEDKGEDDTDQNDEIINIEHLDYFNDNYIVLSTNKNLLSIYAFSRVAMDASSHARQSRAEAVGITTIGSNPPSSLNNPNNTTAQPESASMLSDWSPFRSGEESKETPHFKSFKGSKKKDGSKKTGGTCHFDALCTVRSFRD